MTRTELTVYIDSYILEQVSKLGHDPSALVESYFKAILSSKKMQINNITNSGQISIEEAAR